MRLTHLKIPRNLKSLPRAGNPQSWTRRSSQASQDTEFGELEQPPLEPERYITREANRKRKCVQEAPDPTNRIQDVPTQKRTRVLQLDRAAEDAETQKTIVDKNSSPIQYWVENGSWPKTFFDKDQNMSEPSPTKRLRSTSYSQSVKDGDNPRAYTPKYEKVLEKAGIFMDEYQGEGAISDACQQLCNDLLSGEYETPESSIFQGDQFWAVLRRVRTRNELRIFRDITPLIVPSAELLCIRGNDHLEHLTEELSGDWTRFRPTAGPQPKPDIAVGLMSSAFTDVELLKLKCYTAPDRATLFTEDVYFPFLMCEVKSGDQAIMRADRQNAHSSSLAVKAIVQLYRAVPPLDEPRSENRASSRVMELDKKILAFSISHDCSVAKIYGHYASIQGDKTTFHRHPIRQFFLTNPNSKERWAAYNFTRKVYDTFAPIHLERIRTAIGQLPEPPSNPVRSGISVDADTEAGSSDAVASAPLSHDTANFKVPSLPPTARLQLENDGLRDQVHELRDQIGMLLRQQQEQQRQQQEQQEQNKEIIKMLKEQMSAKG